MSQAVRSPFTTYGLGELFGNALIHHQGTGGLGVSQPQYWFLNNTNPALLVYNNLTVFQAGIVGERIQIQSDTLSQRNAGGTLSYLVTSFPIIKTKWTSSIGLMPYSNVNYELVFDDYVRNNAGQIVDTVSVRETGSGGLTQLYWANGVRLTSDLSIGLRATYLFGPIDDVYSNLLTTSDQPVPYVINVEQKTTVKDFIFGLGVSYTIDSLSRKNNKRLSIGAVYNFESKLNATQRNSIFRTNISSNDTIEGYQLNTQKGQIPLPYSYTVGISYGKGLNWWFGTEYSYQDWTGFQGLNDVNERLGKAWKWTIGGEITPDPGALEGYLKRVTYRTGLTLEQYPYLANGETVKDFGINFGFSLPAGRSSLDFAFKVGKRGDRSVNILEENYFKLYFGITFNDQWFIPRKFD